MLLSGKKKGAGKGLVCSKYRYHSMCSHRYLSWYKQAVPQLNMFLSGPAFQDCLIAGSIKQWTDRTIKLDCAACTNTRVLVPSTG